MKNLSYKILAVVLAIFIWYFVVGEERAEVGFSVPLELINIPRELIVVNNLTQGIEIRVNGPRSLVRDLATKSLTKSLDLAHARPGTIIFPITSEGIPLPRGVKVTRINPTQVVVALQKLMSKKVNVKTRLIGKPALGFEVESAQVNNEQVEIAGPQDVVENLETLYTKPIDIHGLKSDLKQRTYLDFRNHQIYLVKEVPLEVQVTLRKTKNNKE
jgi:YbbR domain-containing protein